MEDRTIYIRYRNGRARQISMQQWEKDWFYWWRRECSNVESN